MTKKKWLNREIQIKVNNNYYLYLFQRVGLTLEDVIEDTEYIIAIGRRMVAEKKYQERILFFSDDLVACHSEFNYVVNDLDTLSHKEFLSKYNI